MRRHPRATRCDDQPKRYVAFSSGESRYGYGARTDHPRGGRGARLESTIQRVADVISGIFVPIVVGIAVVSFIVWYAWLARGMEGAVSMAMMNATAVLVIASPCALGLASPTSIMVGTGKGAEHGLLFKGGEHLENLQKVGVILLDKTGTITKGQPTVTDVVVSDTSGSYGNHELLKLAARAEKLSEHPLASAIVAAGQTHGQLLDPEHFEALTGRGVRAVVSGLQVVVCTEQLMVEKAIDASAVRAVWLSCATIRSIIRQNLFWAPAFSSVSVVSNALRLKRVKLNA